MLNIFCYWHLLPTGNGLAAMGDFHFRDLEIVGSVQERTICNFFSKMSYHLERAVHITIYQEKNTDHEIS